MLSELTRPFFSARSALLSTETTSSVGVPDSSSFFSGTSISTLDVVVASSLSVLSSAAVVVSSISLALVSSGLSGTVTTASHPHKHSRTMTTVMISDFLIGSPP